MLKNYILLFLLICGSTYAQQKGDINENSEQNIAESNILADAVSLYPNPVGEVLKIRSKGQKITKIEIFSLIGGKVQEINSNFKSIYLGNLSRGIYMIKIYSGQGYTVKKLIKK